MMDELCPRLCDLKILYESVLTSEMDTNLSYDGQI